MIALMVMMKIMTMHSMRIGVAKSGANVENRRRRDKHHG